MPVMAQQQYGLGQVLYVGTDDTWRWRRNADERFYPILWGQIAQRLGLSHLLGGSKRSQISADKQSYAVGERVTIYARLYTPDFVPLREATVDGSYVVKPADGSPAPESSRQSVTLRAVPDQPGMYRGDFTVLSPGVHQFSVKTDPGTVFEITATEAAFEVGETAMNEALLRQMAEISDGGFLPRGNAFQDAGRFTGQKRACLVDGRCGALGISVLFSPVAGCRDDGMGASQTRTIEIGVRSVSAAAETPAPPSRPPVLDEAREILARVRRLRRRHGRVALTAGVSMAIAALCLWLVSETITDFLSNLPWAGRLIFFVFGMGGSLVLLVAFAIRPWRRRLDDEHVALLVERALPAFRSRFIAAVQLAKSPNAESSPALIKALIAETTAMAATMDFSSVIDTRRLRRWLKIAMLALLLVGVLAWGGERKTWPLVRRAFLFRNPVPRKTLIENVAAPRVVAIGDPWRVVATAGGIVPAGGHLVLKTASGRRQEFEMPAEGGPPLKFARTLQSMQESFDYRIELGDAETDSAHVQVKPRPGVLTVECRLTYPAYTKLPPQRRALGDLKVLAGSRLALKVRANAKIKTGEIRLVAADHDKITKTVSLQPDAKDRTQLTGEVEIPAKEVAGLTLQLADEDGIESRGAAIYPVEVVKDEPPTIKVVWPDRREELLTREATMLIAFVAKDDYGVAKVRLNYAVDWVEGAPHKSIDLDLGADLPKELNRRFNWRVGQIVPHVEEGSVIDYWFEVLDANDVTGPGVGTTEHMQARIVSEAEKRADLANRLNDAMEGLNGVKQGQEEVNQHLGEIIFEKPPAK